MATHGTLSPILETAKEILSDVKEMHINDIAKEAIRRNKNLGLSVENFAQKLNGALRAHLKLKTKKSIFSQPLNKQKRPRKGMYRLKKGATVTIPILKSPPPPSTFNSLYVGKAGEYAVVSELLFWGFNVSTMFVDHGIDLVAEKNRKFWYIQVKTSVSKTDEGSFNFSIDQKAFDANLVNNPWYILAMRQGMQTDFAVIPCSHLLLLRSSGVISGKNLSIQISRDEKRRQYKLNGSHDINMFINNFQLL